MFTPEGLSDCLALLCITLLGLLKQGAADRWLTAQKAIVSRPEVRKQGVGRAGAF